MTASVTDTNRITKPSTSSNEQAFEELVGKAIETYRKVLDRESQPVHLPMSWARDILDWHFGGSRPGTLTVESK